MGSIYDNPLTSILPPEIFNEIIQCLPQESQLTLISVSRALRSISTRYIYRSVTLKTFSSLLRFCYIVMFNDAAAEAVRKLCFGVKKNVESPTPSSQLLSGQRCILRSALCKVAPHVVELNVNNLPDDYVSCIPHQFPRLHSYLTELNVTSSETIEFIRHNAHRLRRLSIYSRDSELPLQCAINLPNLHTFDTFPTLVPYFFPGTNLTSHTWLITSQFSKETLNAAFDAIRNWDIHITAMNFSGFCPPEWVLRPIPQCLPDLIDLYLILPLTDRNAIYSEIDGILPKMKNLQSICIEFDSARHEHIEQTPDSVTNEYLDDEIERLELWGSLSSTLSHIRILSNKNFWARIDAYGLDTWLPLCNDKGSAETTLAWMRQQSHYDKLLEDILILSENDSDRETATRCFDILSTGFGLSNS
ncbi:hypothetical protein BDQ17DRAFT_1546141 [Cyathus striatus]|nr:hypothetical protein BDQ17DRAFT_1546141 [Cyathus striatus]